MVAEAEALDGVEDRAANVVERALDEAVADRAENDADARSDEDQREEERDERAQLDLRAPIRLPPELGDGDVEELRQTHLDG